MTTIGVLALQGAFAAHSQRLAALGYQTLEIRSAEALSRIDGLILPGGESSTQLWLLERLGMWDALSAFVGAGFPVLATCAGLILLAREVESPTQRSLGALDLVVSRNGWGRQSHSCEAVADEHQAPLVMIRAPRITATGPQIEILWRWQGQPVLVKQGACLGAIFHPELTDDASVYQLAFGHLSL